MYLKKYVILKISIILFLLIFAISSMVLPGCSTINKLSASQEESQVIPDSPQNDSSINNDNLSSNSDSDSTTQTTLINADTTTTTIIFNSNEPEDSGDINDIETQRHYFILGVEAFEAKEYIKAQYYLEKIKSKYLILEDHIRYYIAKSMLLQEKYDLSVLNYQFIINNYKDSIFREKSLIELADSYYLDEDFVAAEEEYIAYIKEYPDSSLTPYGFFQQGVCMEKNKKLEEAYSVFKKIFLEYPETEYAIYSFDNLNRLANIEGLPQFEPTVSELYSRGEKLFKIYYYDLALESFNKILQNSSWEKSYPDIYSKTLFRTGMSFYNMNDYKKAKDYLQENYDKYPVKDLADDSLYYLGRCLTNLDDYDGAINIYKKLIEIFPSSNFADDSLYRAGRIHYIAGDLQNAAFYYQRMIDEYPSGDRISDAYWELGWIQYRLQEYDSSLYTFDAMSKHFKGTSLEEKSLFWKTKSLEKLGRKQEAIEGYKSVFSVNSFSYYGFESANALKNLGINVDFPAINKELDPENPEISEVIPEIYGYLEPQIVLSKEEATHINKAKELLFIEFFDSAASEVEASGEEIDANLSKILEISTMYLKSKDYENSILLVQRNYKKLSSGLTGREKDYYYYLFYPFAYKDYIKKYANTYGIDENFILAIIREESRFKADAGSHAGAQGLMQIMPATGKNIASQLGISNFDNSMLHDPEKSIMMGTYYISQQLKNFGNNKYYALGAYNGGPGAMQRWINSYGSLDIDEFIESITYDETKNYIKKVMESYYIYNMLY
jgi:soluble lytic murein transglycosylase